MKSNVIETVFGKKCSLGSCPSYSENVALIYILGFEKFITQV